MIRLVDGIVDLKKLYTRLKKYYYGLAIHLKFVVYIVHIIAW